MVQVLECLDPQDQKQLKEFLKIHYGQTNELDSYVEEVSMYYEAELAPYYVGRAQDKVTGLLILDEVEEETAHGRIFTNDVQFLTELGEVFSSIELSELVLETPKELPDHSGIEFDYAEYMMALSPERKRAVLASQKEWKTAKGKKISLVAVTANDRRFYETILETQYDMETEEAAERFDSLLEEDAMHGFLVYADDKAEVGIASCYEGTSFVTLFDLTILPEYQNLGYGKAMILELLSRDLDEDKKYLLQVTSSNVPAFPLYQKLGFEVTQQQLYYSFMME